MVSIKDEVVDEITIKLIIRPNLNISDAGDPHLSQLKIEKTVSLNPKTLVKDVCRKVMEEYYLGNLVDDFQVFVQHSNLEYYHLSSFFPSMDAEIGSVGRLFGDRLTIKILIPVKSCGFIRMAIVDRVYENSIEYLLSKTGDVKSELQDTIIQYLINDCSIRYLPLETLLQMDEEITRALQPDVRSMSGDAVPPEDKDDSLKYAVVVGIAHEELGINIDDLQICSSGNSTLSPSKVNREEVPPSTRANRRRAIKYKEEEVAFLEDWYDTLGGTPPDDCILQELSNVLNAISGRSEPNKIAGRNVFNWWKRKRTRERKEFDSISKLIL
uniref:Homeobox domain-containing protein n=1 Tax=Strongyloides papillosus TaxID=174720 RepID=A0A0N5BRR3_STREA